ncbi:MAG: DUF4190 domain-containing protein [Chloroflexi bacterium]|nr:DUF4190 domain-containing protein [Chloroflexota bacterium]
MDFSKIEAEFQKLKAQFKAGAITEAEFKAQLEKLMIQDEQGRWWMIGYETGQWYYHDGEKWVQGQPPQLIERPPAEPPGGGKPPPTSTSFLAIAALVSSIAGLTIVPVIGSILALFLGYKARNDIRQRPGETSYERLATAGIVLGWIGLVLLLLGFGCWLINAVVGGLGQLGY